MSETSVICPMPATSANIPAVLAHFREKAPSNRDFGDRFERLICRYLELGLAA